MEFCMKIDANMEFQRSFIHKRYLNKTNKVQIIQTMEITQKLMFQVFWSTTEKIVFFSYILVLFVAVIIIW